MSELGEIISDDGSLVETVDVFNGAMAAGTGILVLPCINASLAPTLRVMGLSGRGWYIQIQDGFGSVVWERLLEGKEIDQLHGRGVLHHGPVLP